ncbi:hypothetical protein G5I_01258 [Acromyrmex echinatior]|uniref:GRIP domain-containing protein n=1 Tax=Acromyrmex echinatior TaxID=103372 RepID=F4W749_ACREC|nr:hypothetical protein G5I_01258 [Acromyrmex echinatior]
MNGMDRMARCNEEFFLQPLQPVHTGQSTHSTTVISTSPVTPTATCVITAADKVTAINTSSIHVPGVESAGSPTTTSPPSPLDSRIPRPSPSALRRAASLRLRGERLPPHHPRSTTAAAASTALLGHQHHPRRHNHLLQSSQQHQHPDYCIFPVITENGTDSPRQRSFSLSLTPVRPRPGHAASGGTTAAGINDDSDAESVKSYSSACSTASACEHASFALNGTTWSGRSRKYVVHCSNYVGDNEQYLTPTQRAAKQVRKFQALLKEARKEIDEKDREILQRDEERRRLVSHYENRIEDMHRRHVDELQELKQKHNDKVESLLNQLSEVNTRYCEVRPAVDIAETRARELEVELEAVKTELNEQKTLLNEQEERNKQMYLKMYAKGQEAARIEQADQIFVQAHQSPPKVTVAELLQQLTITQAELENIKAMYRRIVEARSSQGTLDPEITLQFLKSAIYYFLTDKENHHGHLNAIESILGFTDAERHNIDRYYRSVRK